MMTEVNCRHHHRLIDMLYISLLALYVLAGMALTPFHGDESTIIHMSQDWYTIVDTHNFSTLMYSPANNQSADQDLRLVNGSVSKYAIGMTGWLSGVTAKEVNSPWNWLLDWWQNLYYGALPDPRLLLVSRLSSTWMTMLSVAVIFAVGRGVGRLLSNGRYSGRGTAWVAAFIYATLPAVLLNGRRAVFEGATMLTIALLMLSGLEIIRAIQHHPDKLWRRWLWLGLAIGFAAAAKHTTILLVAAIVGTLFLISLMRRRVLNTIAGLLIAGIVAGGLFLALNPVWWAMPLQMPGIILAKRATLLNDQATSTNIFSDPTARLSALLTFPFGPPQYYETANQPWDQWLGDQIPNYAASGLAGIDWWRLSPVIGLLLIGGVIALWRANIATTRDAALFMVIVTGFTALSIYWLNPLPWQRYYLPLAAPLALLCGVGGMLWIRLAATRWQRLSPRLRQGEQRGSYVG